MLMISCQVIGAYEHYCLLSVCGDREFPILYPPQQLNSSITCITDRSVSLCMSA